MKEIYQSNFERKKRAEWWLDISKLVVGSLVFPAFLSDFSRLTKVLILVVGLGFAFRIAQMGLRMARNVENSYG